MLIALGPSALAAPSGAAARQTAHFEARLSEAAAREVVRRLRRRRRLHRPREAAPRES